METSLKQRLLGTALLIALAVIFIPMLFDRAEREAPATLNMEVPPEPEFTFEEPSAPVQSPEVQKPTQRPAPKQIGRTEVADTGQQHSPGNAREPEHKQSRADRAGTSSVAARAAESESARDAGSPSAPDDSKEQLALAEPSADSSSARPQASGSRRSPPPPPTAAASAKQPSSAKQKGSLSGGLTGWAVQVGSFSEHENATSLRNELRGAGFAAFEQRVVSAGESVFRVKVGPEMNRFRAEALQAKLRSQKDLNGIVVSHP